MMVEFSVDFFVNTPTVLLVTTSDTVFNIQLATVSRVIVVVLLFITKW